ncbi:uncharacterized protein [Amphiura filiformis]|uniref:uncharacterized protein n=1 Tax=Amphiura filiformis TaxID=82378 RepID=UPI003B21799D
MGRVMANTSHCIVLASLFILLLWLPSNQDCSLNLRRICRPTSTPTRKFLAPVLLYVNHFCYFQPDVNNIALSNDIELNPGPTTSPNSSSQNGNLSLSNLSTIESSSGSLRAQNGMSCLFVNTRSLKNKLLDFQAHVYNFNFKIIGVAETWLADHVPSSCILQDFTIIRNDRNTHGGGVLLAFAPELQPIHVVPNHNFPKTDSQSVWASVVIGKQRWLCGVFYRPRRNDMESLDCLEETLYSLHPERYAGTLLMGDFNVDQSQSNHNSIYVTRLSDIADSFGLHQHVNDITRNNPDSILDLVFNTNPDHIADAAASEKLATSDHYMVTFNIKIKTKKLVAPYRKVYQYAKADCNLLNALILETNWDNIIIDNDIDNTWNGFVETFFLCVNRAIPSTVRRSRAKPWVTPDIKKLISKKHKAFNKAKMSDSNLLWNKYKSLRNQVKYALKRSYQDHWLNMVNKNDNMKRFWSFVKSSRSQPENISFNIDNLPCTAPDLIAQRFNDLFFFFFTHTDDTVEITSPELIVEPFSNTRFNSEMVLNRIKKLAADKAVGPDNISGRMLKMCAHSIAPVLARIFSMSAALGKLPIGWKIAHVVPVYKKGDRSTLSNYRPIALTSVVGKMLEALVCDELRSHLLTNGLMFENQHGFSPGKSCTTALCEATTEWLGALDRRTNPTARIDLISVDYSRAFDSISHHVLIKSFIRPTAFADLYCNG